MMMSASRMPPVESSTYCTVTARARSYPCIVIGAAITRFTPIVRHRTLRRGPFERQLRKPSVGGHPRAECSPRSILALPAQLREGRVERHGHLPLAPMIRLARRGLERLGTSHHGSRLGGLAAHRLRQRTRHNGPTTRGRTAEGASNQGARFHLSFRRGLLLLLRSHRHGQEGVTLGARGLGRIGLHWPD